MDATFEVIRFQVVPAGSAVAVIELEGRPANPAVLVGRPALLLERDGEQIEVRPVGESAGHAAGVLRASFAAPLEIAVDPGTAFALALGRGPLLELPAPHGAEDATLEVRLARTVNQLRSELANARSRLGSEVGHARLAARELAAEKQSAISEKERVVDERRRLETEVVELREEAEELRGELINAQARIDHLESTATLHRVPRTPRRPTTERHRPLWIADEPTAAHAHVPRTDHASLGRTVGRAVALAVLALLLAILVVVVLQVHVV